MVGLLNLHVQHPIKTKQICILDSYRDNSGTSNIPNSPIIPALHRKYQSHQYYRKCWKYRHDRDHRDHRNYQKKCQCEVYEVRSYGPL